MEIKQKFKFVVRNVEYTVEISTEKDEVKISNSLNTKIEKYPKQVFINYFDSELTDEAERTLEFVKIVKLIKKSGQYVKKKDLVNKNEIDSSLYDQLYKAKNKLAAEEKMSSFIIATNASIKEMAFKRPVNLNEIANIKAFGMKRAKKYGHIFLDILKKYKKSKINKETETVEKKSDKQVFRFYDVKSKKHFYSSNYRIEKKKGRFFVVTQSPEYEHECWRVVSSDFVKNLENYE